MSTRAVFTPNAAEFPATNFAALSISDTTRRRPVLAFDAATEEAAVWSGIAPAGLTGSITAVVSYIMASATSGGVALGGSLEAVSSGDTVDLDAGDSFDTETVATGTVPATAGHIGQITITLSAADSIAAGDYFRFRLARKVANAADTATGDLLVLGVEFRDAA